MRLLPSLLILSLAFLLALPFTAQAASQIAPKDGLWLSLPPDSVKCVVLRLPQDAGLPLTGNYIFSIQVTPGSRETWSDLSEQIVREIGENSPVLIPICFDTAGNKPMGNCSAPYTITVSEAYTGTEKSWHGGTCVSEYADVDIIPMEPPPSSGGDIEDILNSNTDIFAAWFEEDNVYVKPGGRASFNLSIQSQAALTYTILTQSNLPVTPASAGLSTSPGSPYQSQAFELEAPLFPGEHTLSARIIPDGCSGQDYCAKLLEATLIVSDDDPPRESGFEVLLHPENIDTKDSDPIPMRLTIRNNDAEAMTFTSSLAFDPNDASSGFMGESIEIGPYESKTRAFILIPGTSSTLYEITARVESQGFTSSATSFITIDEFRTDALRQAQGLGSDSQAQVDEWLNTHADSEYGSDLQSYGSLKEVLAQAEQVQGNQEPQDPPEPVNGFDMDEYREYYESQKESPMDLTWLMLIFFLAAAGILLVYFLTRNRSPGKPQGEAEYY